MENPSYRELMNYAMRVLARRAHTIHELRGKLKKRPHHSPDLEEQVIQRLLELKLLDDEAYVRRRIEETAEQKREGYLKVASQLARKGIPLSQAKVTWNSLNLDEEEIARAALVQAAKRFQNTPPEKRYQKRVQFLASRGFSPSIIFELAKEPDSQ